MTASHSPDVPTTANLTGDPKTVRAPTRASTRLRAGGCVEQEHPSVRNGDIGCRPSRASRRTTARAGEGVLGGGGCQHRGRYSESSNWIAAGKHRAASTFVTACCTCFRQGKRTARLCRRTARGPLLGLLVLLGLRRALGRAFLVALGLDGFLAGLGFSSSAAGSGAASASATASASASGASAGSGGASVSTGAAASTGSGFSAGLGRLGARRRADAAPVVEAASALRLMRSFFFRWRSLRQRRIGLDPRPM